MTQLVKNTSQQRFHSFDQLDSESSLVEQLVRITMLGGITADPITILNLYVSLKSKSCAILVGRENSGKKILIESFIKVLTNSNPIQRQFMLGHAWWSERSDNVALFTHAQSQFNIGTINTLFEEATDPVNKDRAYFVCLERISPAEVVWYFSGSTYEIQKSGDPQRFGVYLPTLNSFSSNYFSIGTMDTSQFNWYDEDLLSQTSIIYWRDNTDNSIIKKPLISSASFINGNNVLLNSCVRDKHTAYSKIIPIIKDQPNALLPLFEVEQVMKEFGVDLSQRFVRNEVIIYLSNAWTKLGNGLFHESINRNLIIALDLALSQIVLPHGWEVIQRSIELRDVLRGILNDQFVYTRDFLDQF